MSSSWPAAPEAERPTGEGDLSFGGLRSPPPRRRKTVAYQQATPSAGARQTQGAPPATPRREAANGKAHAQGHGEAHGGRAGDPRPKPPPDYLAMTRELHAIGNNLNQIARKAHALGTVDAARYDAEARRLEAALREIVAAVKEPGRRR